MNLIHGTAVEFDRKAILIKGQAGSGKSSLALKLLGFGGRLVADDQVVAFRKNQEVFLRAPRNLPSGLEVRGIGIIGVPLCTKAKLKLVINLDKTELERIPDLSNKKIFVEGSTFPFLDFKGIKDPAGAIYALMKYGLVDL